MLTILVHVVDDDHLTLRLESALALARACDGHLRCVYASPTNAYAVVDSFGGVYVMPSVMAALAESEERVRGLVEQELSNEDVSWEYVHVESTQARTLAAFSSLADIMVVARGEASSYDGSPGIGMIGQLLFNTPTPMLIPSNSGERYDPLKPVVIGWNGSREAANVVRSCLPLLKAASAVRVISATKSKKDDNVDFPATNLLEYLSRHGVHAELYEEEAGDEAVPDLLLDHVEETDAGTLMIGGYGHRRLTEYLFGGVTKSLLKSCPVALAIAH